jgi:RNA polymerase sigma factor (sigma-70 family)
VYGTQHTENELLSEMAGGSRSATELIYNQHSPIISKWVVTNGGTEEVAADIFQEAMVILYEKCQQEDFRLSCKIGTYLFAVSKNLWYKKVQRQKREPGFMPDAAGIDDRIDWAYEDDIKAHHEREMHYSQLNNALEQLGEPCRSLLTAFYHKNKSMMEIAEEFGYTNPDNAKTQKYKCLTRLKRLFYNVHIK